MLLYQLTIPVLYPGHLIVGTWLLEWLSGPPQPPGKTSTSVQRYFNGYAAKQRWPKFRDSEAEKVGFVFLIRFPRSVILITLGMRDRGAAL